MTDRELSDLCRAKALLENPGLTARLAHTLGAPIEKGFKLLPPDWSEAVQKASHAALWRALKTAVRTLDAAPRSASSDLAHKLMIGASGGIGGAFGFAALALELPVSTTLMLRSIADVARSEAHDLHRIETRLSCLEVFALGGKSAEDDAAENAYWAVRAGLAKSVSDATAYLARSGAIDEAAPAIVRLISKIANRFGVVVSEQLAAKALPLAGAIAGSTLNVLFMDHFQKMARGHFIVKRLEASRGTDTVRAAYRSIATPVGEDKR